MYTFFCLIEMNEQNRISQKVMKLHKAVYNHISFKNKYF